MTGAGSEAEVPALVRRYLDRALPAGARVPRQVRVAQVGKMLQKPGGRPLRFTAVEEFAVEEVAFSWRAHFPIMPLVSLRVVDRYAAGEGLLEARLFGLAPVMRTRGQAAAEGEAMRYLAELPWVPQAMVANRQLEWHELDEQTVEDVERFAGALPELALELPSATTGVSEADYNIAAAESVGALCMDQQLVRTPAGERIEVCDLLALDGKLIHVKKRGSSSTLSHLFAQGLVSAELLAREQGFRDDARATVGALNPAFAPAIREGRPEWETSEVSYVVITRSQRDTPLTLPFFSLVHLRAAAQRLQDLGYKVSVRKVEEQ